MSFMDQLREKAKNDFAAKIKKLNSLESEIEQLEKLFYLWGEDNGRAFDITLDSWGDISVTIWLGTGDGLKDIHIALDETIWETDRKFHEVVVPSHLEYYTSGIEIRIYARESANCKFVTRETGRITHETETIINCH